VAVHARQRAVARGAQAREVGGRERPVLEVPREVLVHDVQAVQQLQRAQRLGDLRICGRSRPRVAAQAML